MSQKHFFNFKWSRQRDNDSEKRQFEYANAPTIVLAAGGTGGHVMPALSVGQVLKSQGHTVHYLTDQRCIPYFTNQENVHIMPFAGLGGKSLKNILPIMGKMTKGMLFCKKLFKKNTPTIVVGFGGYSTFPPLMIASLLKIPFILYEPDSYLGIVNRFFAKKAKILTAGFEVVQNVPKKTFCRPIGMPVRQEFQEVQEKQEVVASKDRFTIMIIGGSQGAAIFSEVLPAALKLLPSNVQRKLTIIQQVRPELLNQTQEAYKNTLIAVQLQPFFAKIWQEMQCADLIISRAGASSIAEILNLGKAALLVPYQQALNNHQKDNASVLVEKQAAWMIEEPDLTPEKLATFLEPLIKNPGQLQRTALQAKTMGQANAAEKLAQIIEEVGKNPR